MIQHLSNHFPPFLLKRTPKSQANSRIMPLFFQKLEIDIFFINWMVFPTLFFTSWFVCFLYVFLGAPARTLGTFWCSSWGFHPATIRTKINHHNTRTIFWLILPLLLLQVRKRLSSSFAGSSREIMLFIGNTRGRSIMISNAGSSMCSKTFFSFAMSVFLIFFLVWAGPLSVNKAFF